MTSMARGGGTPLKCPNHRLQTSLRQTFPELTVRENLEAPRKLSTDGAAWSLDRVFAMERRHGGSLSGGEQQMLTLFARALADRVYIIGKGVLRFSGTFKELEENPTVKRAHLMV